MLDIDRCIVRFRQFGGFRLAWAYLRMGLLWPLAKATVRCLARRRSLKNVYREVNQTVGPLLLRQYTPLARSLARRYETATCPSSGGSAAVYVWFCWLQGVEHAPALVRVCLGALRRRLPSAVIVEIDREHFSQWVSLPPHVMEKYDKGAIPHPLFSDMLRLQLLAVYGGVWIDSTVLCTMPSATERGEHAPSWAEITGAELFMFQYTKPGMPWTGDISNWFIAAQKGNPLVMLLRDLLFQYWNDHSVTLDYYIFHLFFKEYSALFPEMMAAMPYGWSMPAITMGFHLGEKADPEKWARYAAKHHWHKLSYRRNEIFARMADSYYSLILMQEQGETGETTGATRTPFS